MLRQQRRSPAALIMILFAILPAVGTAAEGNDFEVDVLTATYSGQLAHLIESENARPLSLAAADLDEDGVPDLVVGYGDGADGFFVVHRGNLEAIYPRPGEEAGSAFLPQAQVFESLTRADHIATGDFDADGHFDIVAATTWGTALELHRGDGTGRFAVPESIDLGGRLTAMTAGEVNRRDGLVDVVVGVDRPDGPKILVFESPLGALRGAPESIDAIDTVESIELGNHDDDSFRDIVAVTESYQITVAGRDRRLSVGRKQRAKVVDAAAIAEPLAESAHANKGSALPLATNIDGNIVAHISMRLNRDAFPDWVAITDESPVPVVIKTLSRAIFTVDSVADDPDFSTGDGVCDTDNSAGDGPCTLRAAIQQANAGAGPDAVEFNISGPGPHTIQPVSALPTITDAVTIDGFTQPGASANTIAFPGGLDSVLQVELDGSAAVSAMNGLLLSAGSCVVRGLAINRMPKTNNIYLGSGIYLSGSANSIVEGNFLGTDPGGTSALPNEFYGVLAYSGGAGNTYGGTAPPARNLISSQGVNLAHREGDGALIQGNYIGTDISGTISLNQGTGTGIFLVSAEGYGGSTGDNHTVGGTTAGAGNLVSGLYWGIELLDDTSGNLVQGNLIGPDSSGALVLGIGDTGIRILWNENNTIGGTSPAARNVISGSAADWSVGINVQESPGTHVQGNYIGTEVTGTTGHAFFFGIQLNMLTSGVTIGGAVPGAGNLIAASLEHGVLLGNSSNVTIQGNVIGLGSTGSPLGNSKAGISLYGSNNITIGGTTSGEGNNISSNGTAGVEIGGLYGTSDPGIEVVGNSIHSNTLLGIDIEADGVTPNDVGDGDGGSNGSQNFPVITSVPTGGAQVAGTLNSLPSTQYELAFYSSAVCDPSGHGEGATFLGTDVLTTDPSGDGAFNTNLTTPAPAGSYVTATATDPNGSTSEFSACFVLPAQADLAITKDDGTTSVIAGRQVTYTIVASNPAGPDDAVGVSVADPFPPELDCVWTCIGSGSATCTAGPVEGDISDAVFLPVGGAVTYTAVCDLALSATGSLSNTATVAAPPAVTDPNSANNSATDVDTVQQLDFGDAPDPTMPTLLASDGARHVIGGSLFLGSSVDPDGDGQPTTNADGDDVTGTDDEDGIVFTTSVLTGYNADIEVTASGAGLLNAWLDFNGDGDWTDAGEQIFTDQAVGAGINPFSIPVPVSAATGDSTSRFRLASAGGLAPTGLGADGEVEDHFVEVRFSTLDVAETGQTTSYGAGDDGAYQAGEPWPDPRFTDNGDGSITDGLTGLTWAQDSVNPGPAPCNPGVTRNWFLSLDYVNCLNTNSWLGHTDWRMPNVVELGSLVHYRIDGDHRPWWNSQGFTMTTNYRWWSSTTNASGLGYVYTLSQSASFSGVNKLGVTGIAVWPVRGGDLGDGVIQLPETGQERCWDDNYAEVPCAGTGQDGDHRAGAEWPSPRFEVSGDCVTDRLTGLTWTKDANLFGLRSWGDALDDANGLSLCGFDDWRLPSVREAQTLWHFDKRSDAVPDNLRQWWMDQGFINAVYAVTWSGTSHAGAPELVAWTMWGTNSKSDVTNTGAWPVRGGSQTDTADLSVLISDATDPVNVGDAVVYTVELTNLGPSTASEITVTTTLPAGSTFVAASGSGWACGELDLVVTCDMPTLAVAAAPSITLEITTPPSFGTITAVAIADSLNDDPIGDNNGDFESTTVIAYDFGDAPDPSYPTLAASSGAVHTIGGGLFLGALVDDELDGQPTANADGDDNDGSDDEDGVVLPVAFLAGAEEPVDVTASAAGLLNAWLDFNADGDWDDPGEQIYTDEALAAGLNNLNLTVPLDAAVGATFARFRFDSAGGLTPTGLAADGEVEDYRIEILPSADLEVVIGDSPDPVPEGGLLTYFLTVTNNGQLDAADTVLEQTLPVEGSFTSASHGGCSETGGVVTCDLGTISTGASVDVEVDFIIDFGAVGTMNSTASVQTTDPDPITTNNTDTETTSVVDEPTYIFSDGFETGDTSRWSATLP